MTEYSAISEVQTKLLTAIEGAKETILILLPTINEFSRQNNLGIIAALQRALGRGVEVSMLAPDSRVQKTFEALNKDAEIKEGQKPIKYKSIPEKLGVGRIILYVIDSVDSIIIEVKDDSAMNVASAWKMASFSLQNNPNVRAHVRLFERTWNEIELREREAVLLGREKRAARSAQLLQDILSHDIKNYNQIVRVSADMVKEDLTEDERQHYIDAIIKAIDGSTNLIDRAKKLGKILSDADPELYAVDIEKTLQTSVALVIKSHPQRSIHLSTSIDSAAQVLADDLLQEAFTNILSNSVNYTDRDIVPVEIQVEEVKDVIDDRPIQGWKITFTDQGKGIDDEMKKSIFTRYLNTATGAGLGLSIVHALVVERYSGKVLITDRVQGNHTMGTKVEVFLPKA